jgi:hypothetical protein
MQDRLVFVKIAHALVRAAFNVTITDIGVFRDILGWDMTKRFEPVITVFLSENSRRRQQRRGCTDGSENSTLKVFDWLTTSTRIMAKESDGFSYVFHHHRL